VSTSYFKSLYGRLRLAWRWVAAQYVVTLLLIFLGLAWTRFPDKHAWQVALTLLIPVLLMISVLELQAGTMRRLADDDGSKRVKLVGGAVTLLVWFAVACAFWVLLDWCNDQIPQWAGYFNSESSAHARARLFTYDHIQRWLTILEWILRWIVLPAKVIPYAAATAQWGWRIPWRRVLRILWNWRWWPAVVLASLVAVWLPVKSFTELPHGTVTAQVWCVVLKLVSAYLLAVTSWVLLLAWQATLFARQQLPEASPSTAVEIPPPDEGGGAA
jgi:hypothetical protein